MCVRSIQLISIQVSIKSGKTQKGFESLMTRSSIPEFIQILCVVLDFESVKLYLYVFYSLNYSFFTDFIECLPILS